MKAQEAGIWRVVGAAATGSDHLGESGSCQDSIEVRVAGPRLALAITDGAGTAKEAALGSRVAAGEAVAAWLEMTAEGASSLAADFADRFLDRVRSALAAQLQEGSLDDLATTLSTLLLTEDSCTYLQVCDGWILGRRTSGEMLVLAAPVRGEYANETVFVTSADCREEAVFGQREIADLEAVFLLTDGLEAAAVTQALRQPFAPFFANLADEVASSPLSDAQLVADLEDFLNSPRIAAKSADDKTLLMAVRRRRGEGES